NLPVGAFVGDAVTIPVTSWRRETRDGPCRDLRAPNGSQDRRGRNAALARAALSPSLRSKGSARRALGDPLLRLPSRSAVPVSSSVVPLTSSVDGCRGATLCPS